MQLINTNNEKGSSGKRIRTPVEGSSTSEASFLQISLVLNDVAVDFPVHKHPPDRQRDTPEDVQGPIYEEEAARGCSFCRGTEHGGYPVASYMTVMVSYPCEHRTSGLFGRQTGIGLLYLESDPWLRLVLLLVPWREHGAREKDLHVYAVELEFRAKSVGETAESVLCRSVGRVADQGHVAKG